MGPSQIGWKGWKGCGCKRERASHPSSPLSVCSPHRLPISSPPLFFLLRGAQMVVPSLLDQLQADAQRLQQSGRMISWKLTKPITPADVKLVNGFLVK